MRKQFFTLFIVTVLSATAFSHLRAEESPLEGAWVNTNDATRACPRFEIAITDEGANFVWWGKTSPQDSRYGPFPLSISTNGKSATAEHITNFSVMQFTVKLRSGGAVLTMSTVYTDDSGRDPFVLEEKFEKK